MTLALEAIEKRVGGDLHIADLSLALEQGAVNVLLGPTGAGKTSLMRLMAGLDRPTAGRLTVDGRDVTGIGVRQRSVAMVYQQFVNHPSYPDRRSATAAWRHGHFFGRPVRGS